MNEPGISAVVMARLEQAGYGSIRQVALAGVPAVVDEVCTLVGSVAWRNRRKALERALCQAGAQPSVALSVKPGQPGP